MKKTNYVLFPANKEDEYSIVRRGEAGEPYWAGITDDMALVDALEILAVLNNETPVHDLNARYFYYDEGNGHYHRVDSQGNPLSKTGVEPRGYLVPFNYDLRIWLEVPQEQAPFPDELLAITKILEEREEFTENDSNHASTMEDSTYHMGRCAMAFTVKELLLGFGTLDMLSDYMEGMHEEFTEEILPLLQKGVE